MSYGTLQNDKSQRAAIQALLAGTAPLPEGALAPGSVPRSVAEELVDASNPATRYGATGDGVTNDLAALVAAFASVATAGRLYLPPGDYYIASKLELALSNCVIIGIPGQTRIFASSSTQVLRLLTCSNVLFYGITFETTRSLATEDTSTGVVYMNADGAGASHNLTNISFERCTFSAATCNTNGFKAVLSASTLADVDCSDVSGLSFIDCNFLSLGRMGIEIINHKSGTTKAYSRVRIVRPYVKDTGLGGNFGMGVSFGGIGRDCIVESGTFDNCLILALENGGGDDVTFRDNRVRNQPAASASVGVSVGNTGATLVSGFKLIGHIDETAAPAQSYLNTARSPVLIGNTLRCSSTTQPVLLLRDVNKLKATGDRYVGEKYGVYVDANLDTSYDNEWVNCEFDNSSRTGDGACIYFTGANVARNVVAFSTLLRGSTAEWLTQASSAVDNRLRMSMCATTTGASPALVFGQAILTITASTVVIERDMQCDSLALTGSPSGNFTLTVPRVHRNIWVYNNTAHQASFTFGTGTTANVAAGDTALVCINSSAVSTGCSVLLKVTP